MNSKEVVISVFSTVFKIVLAIIIVMLVYKWSLQAYDYGQRVFNEPPMSAGSGRTVTFIVQEGDSAKEIGANLEKNGLIRDAALFGTQLVMKRTYEFSKLSNTVTITDEIENTGVLHAPCMLLYHFNMGYPLLSENAKVVIPANSVAGRNDHAKGGIDTRLVMEKPQADYTEMCFYYDVAEKDGMATVGIYNPDIKKGLTMSFDKSTLDNFTQWKMMGENEYVLGLEPGNCTPDGRDVMRKEGKLKILKPGEFYKTKIVVRFTEKEEDVTSL